jgi:hypothetical protein
VQLGALASYIEMKKKGQEGLSRLPVELQ